MNTTRKDIAGLLLRYASRLRYPQLFLIVLLLLQADILIPDVIPLVDELILAPIALLLGMRQKQEPSASAGNGNERITGGKAVEREKD